MKGVAKEALISMIKDKGVELRSSDGVTALYETDARYFPTDSMVKNIVGRAIRAQRLHAHDQPACEAFVKREQELKPDDKWYFRASTPQQVGTDDQFGIHGPFVDMQSCPPIQDFLLVHQTEFQQQMMRKYGRTIVGMDATYKVCKWSFPFFLLTVVTNHGHAFPVAMFFMENESGSGIAEALSIIRKWNPDWRPAYMMVDKDTKEENAINEQLAPLGTKVLLCDFHRLQAWERALNKTDMGVRKGRKLAVKAALSDLARAGTIELFEAKLAAFKQSDDYMCNPKLSSYLATHWWPCAELWAACYRKAYHGGIDTNNHQEALNRALKYRFLNSRVSNEVYDGTCV